MYKMKSDINFSLTHEMLENAENERIHTSYAQEKAILECVSNGDIHGIWDYDGKCRIWLVLFTVCQSCISERNCGSQEC